MTPAIKGIVYSLIAGMATSIGAIPFLFWKKGVDRRSLDMLLGLAAGIMLAATAFSLVVPSIQIGGPFRFVVGFILGAIFVDLMDKFSPHEHFIKGYEGPMTKSKLSKIWLFVIAITLHNFPEGMAVGVGGFTKDAFAIAMAIGIQNIPEGAAVAGSLIGAGYSVRRSFWVTFLTGAVEIIGGALGAFLITISQPLLPYAMAFAGGAMLYVIGDEIIPETHSGGYQRISTYSLLIGFIIMTLLDNLLG
ncbi:MULTISPECIES: ZIP family metal transporter [Kosmotoga]|jgi:ZIP family zinc transporter|uniref:Zinc/iron permease n=1 Tax=Kosmotoga olearia (strain ATCC BAA-1733 / DSM 21960 / TBF 19.5.1) TaxID=521045 RepID=C5CHA5_KOSOT|nr:MULTISPECIES: ZIP family metal transporter [Kosmotoga]ACR78744.1 zinc/iron permease [Kosmotoga olearia TBF 19.5.1]MDI3524550.1 zinc transporter, family [Kosmotoga sp.]MDK2952654.1 zinc transporter, family [Kosmotoga sp.]OAA25536.1 protein gufA [Kosmotoga sp. DU53]